MEDDRAAIPGKRTDVCVFTNQEKEGESRRRGRKPERLGKGLFRWKTNFPKTCAIRFEIYLSSLASCVSIFVDNNFMSDVKLRGNWKMMVIAISIIILVRSIAAVVV